MKGPNYVTRAARKAARGKDDMVAVGIRIPKELHNRLLEAALSSRRSLGSQMIVMLERYYEEKPHD
jgi:predicted HicB family RNase H-like nuclease